MDGILGGGRGDIGLEKGSYSGWEEEVVPEQALKED
jgi:hypothetical protein